MAAIEERKNANGEISYRVLIRKKGIDISRTFDNKETAILFEFYKEKLINNMSNFDVPLNKRVTLRYIVDLKLKDVIDDMRFMSSFKVSLSEFEEIFGIEKFLHEISYEDWLEASKKIFSNSVYRGYKTEKAKRDMSLSTFKKRLAYMSSCITYAVSLGIELENHPLKVIQVYINPMMNKDK